MTKKVENLVFIIVAIVLIGTLGFRIYKNHLPDAKLDNFAIIQNELNEMGKIEGKNILDLFRDEERYLETSLRARSNSNKFFVILSDSSCHPCFSNYIR